MAKPPKVLHESFCKEDRVVFLFITQQRIIYRLDDLNVGGMTGRRLRQTEDSDEFMFEDVEGYGKESG